MTRARYKRFYNSSNFTIVKIINIIAFFETMQIKDGK
jgi:hypothetical protein